MTQPQLTWNVAIIPFDGPDNITVSPHGFTLACTDGEDDQWLVA